jgi:LysM repeat protein
MPSSWGGTRVATENRVLVRGHPDGPENLQGRDQQEVAQVRLTRLATTPAVAIATLAATAIPAAASGSHTVAPGETLWSIAAGSNLTTRAVAAFNGLPEDAQVVAGQTIEIPTESEGTAALASAGTTAATTDVPATGAAHVVQPGETLTSVAAANGISAEGLAAANDLAADAYLIAGREITIPAATSSVTTPTAAAPADTSRPYWTSPVYCPSCQAGEAYLSSNAAANWNAMREESLNTYGIDLYPAGPLSAYRSYEEQLYLYDLYLAGQGALAAPPGSSAHEYGASIDLADPAMADVIDQIGAAYGWAKTEASGEWWHVNYVGP